MLFELGQILATPLALKTIKEAGEFPPTFLQRHRHGDWGDLSEEDKLLNDEAVKDGSRILSAYQLKSGEKIWIITESSSDAGHRAATTVLLPEEY